ncbi:MAG: hypothetical protein MUF49_11520 [Oculatellaceae cyanobacterium Prado106]|nr:hypothetical protein [Oculatellaceae cyanobacterium Prado106]
MRTLEFKATPQNGIVALPSEYSSEWEGKTIRVILLDEAISPTTANEAKTSHLEKVASDAIPQPEGSESLLSRLKQIKISAPPDFSENLDAYLNGEKEA